MASQQVNLYRCTRSVRPTLTCPPPQVLQEANVNGMDLREGKGGAWERAAAGSQVGKADAAAVLG